jgi:hypothetical protein
VYENDTIRQVVQIVTMNEDSMTFRFVSENKQHAQKIEMTGVAINRNAGLDPEIIEDEEDGLSYAVDEYTYEGYCCLWFSIELENQSRMTIEAANCKTDNPYCPVHSAGTLKRQ